MRNRTEKITRAAHIKSHTKGTSNELSFSVLDAAKDEIGGDVADGRPGSRFGRISLFTLPGRRKKPVATPTKERGLPLSTGDFVSVEDDASALSNQRGPASGFLPVGSPLRWVAGEGGVQGGVPAHVRGLLPAAGKTTPAGALPALPARAKPSPEEEIARRKARRRTSKIAAAVFVVAVSLSLVGAGAAYLYNNYQSQRNYTAILKDGLNLIKQADAAVLELDELVSDPFAKDAESKRRDVSDKLSQTETLLKDADKKVRTASVELQGGQDKEAANRAVAAIAARQEMIVQGRTLIDDATGAQKSADLVSSAWSEMIKGDDMARKAAKVVANTTPEHVEESKDDTNKALEAFQQALAQLEEAQSAYSGVDLGLLTSYVSKRQESLGYAIASDDAILAKNKEQAASQNDLYNKSDEQAVALAKEIPDDPAGTVRDAYEAKNEEATKAYASARLQAGAADAFIRDYLGAESK